MARFLARYGEPSVADYLGRLHPDVHAIFSAITERLAAARATLDTLELVLAQGEDLTHAAKVVQLAEDLMVQSQDLAAQVQRAKDQASQYARLTTTLLACLTASENAE